MNRLTLLGTVIFLTGCSSPPQPPVVDGSNRQAINKDDVIEETDKFQFFKEDCLRQQIFPSGKQSMITKSESSSQTIRTYFPVNSAQFSLNDIDSKRLQRLLTKAQRLEVRGRTDGQHPSAADERMAQRRALAAQQYLIGKGVSSEIISVNYLSAGDYIADNESAVGKGLNRRVEIEIFTP